MPPMRSITSIPLIGCCARSTQPVRATTRLEQVRHMSTPGRLRRRLQVPSSPLFAPPKQAADHIIYAPPSSAPNVYHTPVKFLPPDDPRRRLSADIPLSAAVTPTGTPLTAQSSSSSSPSSPSSSSSGRTGAGSKMGIILKDAPQKKYHLTKENFDEIRQLREADPDRWTVTALAKKYECSKLLITMIAPNATARAKHFENLEDRDRFRASRVFRDRARRRAMWSKV